MIRFAAVNLLSICVTLTVAAQVNAGGYVFQNGFYYSGGIPYTRVVVPSCYSPTGYIYQYKQAYVAKPAATYTTTNYTYTYNIAASQPAAPQANTLYGVPGVQLALSSYGALDIGATVDGLLRLSADMQTGAKDVAGDVSALTSDLAALTASQNQAITAVAEIQAKTELLRAAAPSPQLALSFQTGIGEKAIMQNGIQLGALTAKYCASCHGANGANREVFSLESLSTLEGKSKAVARIVTTDPELKMPKGQDLNAVEQVELINELSQ